MKKFVKPAVIAASVAAIAGLGAVSFAAWNATDGANTKDLTDNTLGAVNIVSIKDKDSLTSTVTELKPWDQDGTNATYKSQVIGIELGNGYDKSDVKINIKLGTVTYAGDTNGTIGDASLYVTTTTPTRVDPTTDTANYKAVTAAGTDVVVSVASDGNYTLNFVLVSSDLNDMGAQFTLTYTVSEGDTAKA